MRMRYLVVSCLCFSLFVSFLFPKYSFAQERVIPSSRVSSHLNVRETSNVTSDIVGTLEPGQSAELLESVPYWYRVRLQNAREGFVSKAWAQVITVAQENGEVIRLGAWNIKKLGHENSKNFPIVARIINENFDIVAVVEVMQKQLSHPGYNTLLTELGSNWSGLVTDRPRPNTNVGHSEFYAIFYRTTLVRPCTGWTNLVYHDDNDGSGNDTGQDHFSREPAYGCFEAPQNNSNVGIDFLLAAYHAR